MPFGEENPIGKNNCPLIPTISLVPILANVTVNGTFLSPGATSILVVSVPKYASRNFTPIIRLESVTTPCGGVWISASMLDTQVPDKKIVTRKKSL